MGIKDNFSQAVKELWKKDGLEETGEKTDKPAQPTELDRYLNAPQEQFQQEQAQPQQMMGQTAQQSAQPVQPANPSQPMQSAQQAQNVQQSAQAPQQGQNTQGYQFSQQADAGAAGAPLETSYYRDQNAQNNMGAQNAQNMQNPQMAQGMQNAQGVPNYGAANNQGYGGVGGGMADIAPDFQADVKALLEILPKNIREYNKIFTGNVIAKNRMEGVGYISKEDCVAYGVTGPSGRASGWACDVRKTHPYSIYPELDFEEVTATEGDSMARFKVRLREIEESAKILAQLVDNIPEGEYCVKVPKVLKLPVGTWFEMVEGCRGVFAVYLESDGSTKPYRLKIVPPCLPLAAAVDHMTQGQKIADLITIGGSLDYIVPDMDR